MRVFASNHNRSAIYKKIVNLFFLFNLLSPLIANSSNFTASVFYGSEYSDNIDKAPNNALKESTSNVGFGFGFAAESVRYQYQGGYDFTYVDYLYNSSDDEFQSSGNLSATFELIEDILSWSANHTQTYIVTDRRSSDARDNRERFSTLVFGPTFNLLEQFNPAGVNTLTVTTQYAATGLQGTDAANSKRGIVNVTWTPFFSRLTSYPVSVEYNNVKFDNESNDYEFFRYSVGLKRILKQGNFGVDIGLNKTKPKNNNSLNGGEQDDEEAFINTFLQNNWQWGRNTINLNVSRKLTDSTFGLADVDSNSDITGIGSSSSLESAGGNLIVQDFVDRKDINISYRYFFDVDSLSLRLIWYDEDYQVEPADQSSILFGTTYNMVISRRSSLNFSTTAERVDFKDDESVDEETTYDMGVGYTYTYPLTSKLDLGLAVNYERRLSYGSVSPRHYEETSGALSLRYTPL